MVSSVETFLINPPRCQDSKGDQCGKKRMKTFFAGSLSMADWLWTSCPFPTHPCIHPFCKVALQLLSSRGRVPTSWTWASLAVYGQQNEVEGTLCQFSRPHPQEACVFLCSSSGSSTSAMRACPGSPTGWKVMNRAASAQPLQVTFHIYESKNKISKPSWSTSC